MTTLPFIGRAHAEIVAEIEDVADVCGVAALGGRGAAAIDRESKQI